LNEAARRRENIGLAGPLAIDDELPLADLDRKFLEDLELLAPFGPGNPRPLFLSRGLRVKGLPKRRGRDTLQCWVSDERGKTTCEVVGFRAYNRWMETAPSGAVDIVHQPTLKHFNGIASIQLELEDWR
jgi:single-stranded-DNA-specific exonuclease